MQCRSEAQCSPGGGGGGRGEESTTLCVVGLCRQEALTHVDPGGIDVV